MRIRQERRQRPAGLRIRDVVLARCADSRAPQDGQAGHGVVQLPHRPGSHDRRFQAPVVLYVQLTLPEQIPGVEVQEFPQLRHHPREAKIRRLRVGVAAADVGVHAGEPALREGFRPGLAGGLRPDGGREGFAVLVEGEGVEGVFDVGGDVRVDEGVLGRVGRDDAQIRDPEGTWQKICQYGLRAMPRTGEHAYRRFPIRQRP